MLASTISVKKGYFIAADFLPVLLLVPAVQNCSNKLLQNKDNNIIKYMYIINNKLFTLQYKKQSLPPMLSYWINHIRPVPDPLL